MEALIKIFPFIPPKNDVTKLIIALLFYILGSSVAISIATILLALTIILAPLIAIVTPLICLYAFAGIVFTVLSFFGIMKFGD